MSADVSGLSEEVVKLLIPYLEARDAKTRRRVAKQVIDRITTEVGQALERVRAEFDSPVKSSIVFDGPLKENDPIERLRLPRGLTSRLKHSGGFETIGQLRDADDFHLKIREVGPKTLAKIDAHLDAAGFSRPLRGQGTNATR